MEGRRRSATQEAIELHERVNPARWCITWRDLKFFQSEIHRAVRSALNFQEHFDLSLGPSIYAVNEYFIKPVTAAAGKMSWALMMNPQGLDCDVFITHAWQESIFEFTQKVLASWPWRARHAWCCMLANPQNLNIAALIQCPRLSPFALALRSSKFLLVVPNQNTSVYTRLWCGYEAYLAFQSNKIIQTARPPIWPQVMWAWLLMCPALLVGILVGVLFGVGTLTQVTKALSLLASLVSQNSGHNKCCLTANHLGLAAGLASLVGFSDLAWLVLLPPSETHVSEYFVHGMLAFYFILAELDRVQWRIAVREAKLLENQYQGSIRHASCSQIQDELSIRSEIGNEVDEVDKVIQVLLKAGMTSDALRTAYMRGVVLRHSGVIQWAIPAIVLGPFLILASWHLTMHFVLFAAPDDRVIHLDWYNAFLQAVSIIARLCFWITLFRGSVDERCFMLNAMTKTVAPCWFLYTTLPNMSSQPMIAASRTSYHLSFVVALLFALLGIRGTLKLPFGPFFAQMILSRVFCQVSSESTDETSDELERSDSSPQSDGTVASGRSRSWVEPLPCFLR